MQNRRIVNALLSEAGADARPRVESNSTLALVAHVATGQWASVVPDALAELLAGSSVSSVPLRKPQAAHSIGLIAAFREPHTPALASLLEEAARFSKIR